MLQPARRDAVPTTPASGDSAVGRITALLRQQRFAAHARRFLAIAGVVTVVGAGASLYLSRVGIDSCTHTAGGEHCTHTELYPLSVQVRSEKTMVNGALDGPYEEWYMNGQPWLKGAYEKGVKVGTWREWHSNGLTRFLGHYSNDQLVGHEQWFYASGQLEWEVDRVAGKREGPETWWYPTGTIRRTGAYHHGDRHGAFAYYAADGAVITRSSYVDGVLTAGNGDT